MAITAEGLREKLVAALNAIHCEVEDLSDGCGAKISAVIVSEQFEGKALLQRHRLVNSVLEEELKIIHAFSQKTLTPEQWRKQNPTSSAAPPSSSQ